MRVTADEARAALDRDRYWCIYALGDLDPRRAAHCRWFCDGLDSAALIYREFDTPIFFGSGGTAALEEAMEQEAPPCFFQIPLHHLDAVSSRFELEWKRRMHRLRLDVVDFRPVANASAASLLDGGDEAAIRELYADGAAANESPDFFFASQLNDATFHGVRLEDGSLVAAGGTHLYSEPESIGAVGNIYTHRQHRGRGYGAMVTSAIVQSLLQRGIRTIALNVKQGNDGARRIYERLGFRHDRDYWEALAAARRLP